jgi:hypothetical protein
MVVRRLPPSFVGRGVAIEPPVSSHASEGGGAMKISLLCNEHNNLRHRQKRRIFYPGERFYTMGELCIRGPLKRELIIVPFIKGYTLALWLKSISTRPVEKYTAIPNTHDLYASFCQGKKSPASECSKKLKQFFQFLVLHRRFVDHPSFRRARPSRGRDLPISNDKTPYKNYTGLFSQQLKVHRFFVKKKRTFTKNINPRIFQFFE